MRGFGSDIPDVPFVCPAQQQLYQTARQLYPGDDAQQFSYILTHGPGFAGNWQAWCLQNQVVSSAAPPGTTAMQTAASTGTSMPWWVWLAVPVVLGGAYAFGREMGWIGKKA